jgi:5-dehydro-2-deoxygluconokinase
MGRIGYDLHAIDRNRRLAHVERFSRHLGGSSANIAVGLARLGLQVGMISCVGKDALAEYLIGFLKQEGVDTRFVREAEGYNTSLCLTEVCPPSNFHQVFYRQNPADSRIEIGDAEREYIRKSKLFLANGTGLAASPAREATVEGLRIARAAGIRTFLDVDYRASSWRSPADAGRAVADVLSLVDVLLANDEEMALVTNADSPEAQADFVLDRGVKIAICKLGAKGVRAYTAGEQHSAEPIPVEIVSSIGAGDGFAAGFLAALFRGVPLPDALWHGNAAAAVVVSRVSCSDAMPYPEELEAYLKAAPGQSRAGRAPA